MIVKLRVYDPPQRWWRRLFGRRDIKPLQEREKTYIPAVIDLSEIRFAYVDCDGDINFQRKDTGVFYAIEYSDQLLNNINAYVQSGSKKIAGFVDNTTDK